MRKSKCSDEKNARKEADLLITIKSITASVHMDDARKMRFIRLPFQQMLIDSGSYRLAWIGYAEQNRDKTLHPVASAGNDDGGLENAHFSWGDNTLGKGPTGTSVRKAETVIINDILTDPDFNPWREAAREHGYQDCAGAVSRLDIDGQCKIEYAAGYRGRGDPRFGAVLHEVRRSGQALHPVDL